MLRCAGRPGRMYWESLVHACQRERRVFQAGLLVPLVERVYIVHFLNCVAVHNGVVSFYAPC
jgi:hypothetical protein